MQVPIFEAVLVCRDVEIPDTCPHCGVSFLAKEDSNLLEWRLEDSVVATSTDPDADSDDDISETAESVWITGYSCRSCGGDVHPSRIVEAEVSES